MCLAVPMRLKSINGDLGVVDIGGVERSIGLMLIENPEPGDYVLVHAGFAIQKLNETEAEETLELLRVIARNEVTKQSS